MKYATIIVLCGISLFSLFSCGSDLGVEIPNVYIGPDLEIIPGVPNVIIKSEPNDPNEFIDPRAATVTYIVYDDAGNLARPGTIVKGLPGITGILNQFTITSLDGTFTVNNVNLPDWSPLSDRTGQTVLVTYTTSQGDNVTDAVSASNVYVPNRMHVRIRVDKAPELRDSWYITCPSVIVERQSGDGPWQQIPSHLRYVTWPTIYAAECSINDPASYKDAPYNDLVKYAILAQDKNKINVSSVNSLRIYRLRKTATYHTPDIAYRWLDTNPHYFTFVLDSYYGEKKYADAVIKMAPIQAMPLIKNVDVYSYSYNINPFVKLTGEMDLGAIDYTLFYATALDQEAKTAVSGAFTLYSPIPEDSSVYEGRFFTVTFNYNKGANSVSNPTKTGIANPNFEILSPYIGLTATATISQFELTCTGTHFYPLNWCGFFVNSGPPSLESLRIVPRGIVGNLNYTFSDILVTYQLLH